MAPENWEEVTGWIHRWRTDGGDEPTVAGREVQSLFDPLGYDPEVLTGRADITTELGLLPAEFVKGVIEAEGGKLRQQEFRKYGNFSPSTLCRLLQDLEAEGQITRYRVGKEKVVTLADGTGPRGDTRHRERLRAD